MILHKISGALKTSARASMARHPQAARLARDAALLVLKTMSLEQVPGLVGRFLEVRVPRSTPLQRTSSPATPANIKILLRFIEQTRHLSGDIAECGVYRGGTLIPIALYLGQHRIEKRVYGFDSFEGFDVDEVSTEISLAGAPDSQKRVGGFSDTSWETLCETLRKLNVAPRVTVSKGFFRDTLSQFADRRFCFVHLDCDVYQAYRDCLEFFYPRVVPGGVILLDEYNDPPWPGCNKAVDEFLRDKPERLEMVELDCYQKWFFRKLEPLQQSDLVPDACSTRTVARPATLEFVNHSGFVLDTGEIRMFQDPWLDGRVFNRAWSLVAPSKFTYGDFAGITHLWFSHEHPDHFNPPNLMRIDKDIRKNITVHFQMTSDKRVVSHCRDLGFGRVLEMPPGEWVPIGPGVEAMCEGVAGRDSWIAVRVGGITWLNTNDCGLRHPRWARRMREMIGRVDVLLTQFSYAYWVGNAEQRDLRQRVAEDKLVGLAFQIEHFRPEFTIPIGSFVWFCHEENCFINDEVVTARRVHDFIKDHGRSQPVILFPGDRFRPGEAFHDSAAAIARWDMAHRAAVEHPELQRSEGVAKSDLIEASRQFSGNLVKNYTRLMWMLRPARVHVRDLDCTFMLEPTTGLNERVIPRDRCDVSLSSDSLMHCFKFPWGMDTLGVNGRYSRPARGKYRRFYNMFRFDLLRTNGHVLDTKYFAGVAWRRTLSLAERAGMFGRARQSQHHGA